MLGGLFYSRGILWHKVEEQARRYWGRFSDSGLGLFLPTHAVMNSLEVCCAAACSLFCLLVQTVCVAAAYTGSLRAHSA